MVKLQRDLFIGVTSWNSALFLPVCLAAIRQHTTLPNLRLYVLDNALSDESVAIAKGLGG